MLPSGLLGAGSEDRGWDVELLDLTAVAQDCDAITEPDGLVEVVGDDDDRLADLGPEPEELEPAASRV